MKKITKVLALVIVAAMAISMLCACSSEQEKIEALAGTWTMVAVDSEEQVTALLESFDMYEEEIALADMESLKYVQIVEFTADKQYRFAIDADATKEYVREFFLGYFEDLYDGRATLNEVYGVDFEDMTEDEFYQVYADMYELSDYDELIDQIAENAYDYEALAEDMENGTYTIIGNDIMCTIEGESQAESLGYTIDGDTLTLVYSNAEEVYTRG